jgi:5-methylcytosine-specific restriction endonuclease McrA
MTHKEKYLAYLQTDYWKQVSSAVKARAGFRCQVCNRPDSLQAHHRSYAHLRSEMDHLDDLICLCELCHSTFHGKADEKLPNHHFGSKRDSTPTLVTAENVRRLRCAKPMWHWMRDHRINPQKKGWRDRMIGLNVPAYFFRKGR